jgi:hypothetical protein
MSKYLYIISIITIFIMIILYIYNYTYIKKEHYQNKDNKFYKSSLNINDFQDIIAMRDSSESQKSDH